MINTIQGGSKTKNRTLILVFLIMAVLFIAGSCATGKKAVTVPIEPLLVTWVNQEYNKTGTSWPKIIFKPDGTWATFGHTDITEGLEGPFTIIDSWIDSDRNKYYKIDAFLPSYGGTRHILCRLNETDTIFEMIWSNAEYPTEIEPEHPRYIILYRK